jgi:hypothetical protein
MTLKEIISQSDNLSQLQVDAPNMGQVMVSQVKSQALLSVEFTA